MTRCEDCNRACGWRRSCERCLALLCGYCWPKHADDTPCPKTEPTMRPRNPGAPGQVGGSRRPESNR